MNSVNRVTIASILIGTILEWYDFSLLGSLAPVISKQFFPSTSPALSLMATFGVFATGFIARPIGGLLFGHIGDRHGRKNALSMTIVLMSIPTTLIGLLPNFHNIGVIAPILLITLRILQGFAASGEYPGAICLLAELAPTNKRGFYASISMLGVVGGVFLGSIINSLLSSFLTNDQIYDWGWRIPFILGLPLGFVGWYLRYKTDESALFKAQVISTNMLPINELLKFNLVNLLKIILYFSLSTVSFYMGFVYIVSCLINERMITFKQGLIATSISTAILALFIPLVGYISDIIDRRKLMTLGSFGLFILLYPIFKLFLCGEYQYLLLGQIILALLIALLAGPLAAMAAESFSTSSRYSGISTGLNIGAAVFGGTCPLIATYFVHQTENPILPCMYPTILAGIFLLLQLTSTHTYQSSIKRLKE